MPEDYETSVNQYQVPCTSRIKELKLPPSLALRRVRNHLICTNGSVHISQQAGSTKPGTGTRSYQSVPPLSSSCSATTSHLELYWPCTALSASQPTVACPL